MGSDLPVGYKKPRVKLSGQNGNAYVLMGRVSHAMRDAGISQDTIKAFVEEATAGDYDHLLKVCMKYAEVR